MRRAIVLAAMLALVPGAAVADDQVQCEGIAAFNVVEDPCSGPFTLDATQNVRVEIRVGAGFTGCLYGFVDLPGGGTLIAVGGTYVGGVFQSGRPDVHYRFASGTYFFWVGTYDLNFCDTKSPDVPGLGPVGTFSGTVTPA